MELAPNADVAFSSFCNLNHLFWTQIFAPESPAKGDGVILVDLWHESPGYILRSLLISKYMQCHIGARIIGLTGKPGVVERSCPHSNPENAKKLAQSFGVDTFWEYQENPGSYAGSAKALLQSINRGQNIEAVPSEVFRRRLKFYTMPDGFPIGRFVYDTVIRSELCATITSTNSTLEHWTADVVALWQWISSKLLSLSTEGPLYFVVGHLDYNPWGVAAEKIRRHGGDVFWFRPETNVPLYRIAADAQPKHTLNAVYHHLEKAWFQNAIWPHHEDFENSQKSYEAGNALRIFYQKWTTRNLSDLPALVAKQAAREWKKSYGWDDNTPVIGVFSHAFADQPIADWQLYDDRYVWLIETLLFAAQHPERNWIIKLHPVDLHYDNVGTSRKLMTQYAGFSHIKFVHGEAAFNVVQELCDIGVTICGSPGLQMAVAGKPVICAGNGPYTDCGFVHRPRDIEEYHRLLLEDPKSLHLTDEQISKAKSYEYASALAGTPSSPLLLVLDSKSDAYLWSELSNQLRHHHLLSDELYHAIGDLLKVQSGRICQPFVGKYQKKFSVASSEDVPELPEIGFKTPLYFSAEEAGRACLIQGFNRPVEWGVWTNSDTASLVLRVPLLKGRARIAVNYKSVPMPLAYPPILVYPYIDSISCGPSQILKKKGTLYIDWPQGLRGQEYLILRFTYQNLIPLAEIRLTDNQDRLGMALTSIRLCKAGIWQKHVAIYRGAMDWIVNWIWRFYATILYMKRG